METHLESLNYNTNIIPTVKRIAHSSAGPIFPASSVNQSSCNYKQLPNTCACEYVRMRSKCLVPVTALSRVYDSDDTS